MAIDQQALALLFYRELEKIAQNEALDQQGRIEACYQLAHLVFQEVTRPERLVFTTHFARIAYTAHKYQLDKTLLYYLHQFRRKARKHSAREAPAVLQLGYRVVRDTIEALWQCPPPPELLGLAPDHWPLELRPPQVTAFMPKLRVLAVADEPEHEQLLARSNDEPERVIRIQYNLPERNDYLQPTIELLRKVVGFPVVLNLLDVEIDAAGLFRPRAIVVDPDYLMDVSAVAECYKGAEIDPWSYLLNKFLPFENTLPRLLGNLANFFLDELMTDPNASFPELRRRIFALQPLAFCLFNDQQIRELMGHSQKHFIHLKQLILQGFEQEGIMPADCYLEPSFYSETYGLQGRLDLLHRPARGGRTAIVELKSGKPFMTNIHGISSNHFIQTALYDLLIRSAFGTESDPASYILYSGVDERHLRFAPAGKAQQFEALQLRNQLAAIDRLMGQLGQGEGSLCEQADRLFGRLSLARYPQLKGFARDNIALFESAWKGLNTVEKSYFAAFAGLTAREHALAKTGVQAQDKINGLASLWLDEPEDKEQNFEWMAGLQMAVNHAREPEPLLTLVRTERTNPLANFRVGDIAVLYPAVQEGAGALMHQIFKCTIVAIDPGQVTVRLRSRQFNDRLFREQPEWNIEHDLLDSSFLTYYRSLFAFAQCSPARRALLMGIQAPAQAAPTHISWPEELSPQQQTILSQVVAAPDYFLLWGPPGTGKTSQMLHHLVRYLLEHTHEHLLLLAYTNRAVDEICESITRIEHPEAQQYLRIGSRDGTAEAYRHRLLQTQSEGISSRRDLVALLEHSRLIVGTVASMTGKPELLQLKKFSRLIIDEASQILEPGLMGLLAHFDRWTLIGDHRQLPAVVAQPEEDSRVQDPALRKLGFHNLRDSLFERLYRQCQQHQWHWAYAQLNHQGRMHQDIMQFPGAHFYDHQLHILPGSLGQRQQQALNWALPAQPQETDRWLCRKRLLFVPTDIDQSSPTLKTNQYEAHWIGQWVESCVRLYEANQRAITPASIGIITPYRAQIALIRQALHLRNLHHLPITIDTVERYQGGARDIILISLCTNSARQMSSLSSLSYEGVDRKLNVAMTRAREHLLILGNPALLQQSPIYQRLLEYCYAEGSWMDTHVI